MEGKAAFVANDERLFEDAAGVHFEKVLDLAVAPIVAKSIAPIVVAVVPPVDIVDSLGMMVEIAAMMHASVPENLYGVAIGMDTEFAL